MRSKTCQFQYIFKHRNVELLLLFSIISPRYQRDSLEAYNSEFQAVIVRDLQDNTRKWNANMLLLFLGLNQELGSLTNGELNSKLHHTAVDPMHYQTKISVIHAIGDVAHYSDKIKLILTGFAQAASSFYDANGKVFESKALPFAYCTTKCTRSTLKACYIVL